MPLRAKGESRATAAFTLPELHCQPALLRSGSRVFERSEDVLAFQVGVAS
jgi:hypothetical protein